MLSLGNEVQLPQSLSFNGVDKLQHVAAYGTLGVLWAFAIRQNQLAGRAAPSWLWLLGSLCLLGAGMEYAQYAFFPNRYFEFADMLANGVGAGIGLLVFNRIFPT